MRTFALAFVLLALGVQAGAAPTKARPRVVLRVEAAQPGVQLPFTVALLAADEESRLIQGDHMTPFEFTTNASSVGILVRGKSNARNLRVVATLEKGGTCGSTGRGAMLTVIDESCTTADL